MSTTPGICINDTYCSLGGSHRLLSIPLSNPFRCPECSKPLSPPPARASAASKLLAPMLLGGGALALLGGAVFVGMQLSASRPGIAIPSPTSSSAHATLAKRPPLLQPTPIAAPAKLVVAPPAPPGPVSSPVSSLTTTAVAPGIILAQPAPPAGPRASAAGAMPPLTLVQAAPARPKLSAVPVPPPISAAAARLALQQEADAAAAKEAARLATLPSHPFSPHVIRGGTPVYPAAYVHAHPAGEVTVDCAIKTDGSPSACHVVSTHGGRDFASATLGWLHGGQIRFAPIVKNGTAVSEQQRWSIAFPGPSDSQIADDLAKTAAIKAAAAPPPPPAVPNLRTLPAAPVKPASAQAPAEPKRPDAPFMARAISGGAPTYPDEYANDERAGRVAVSCIIGLRGDPSGCHVMKVTGGGYFATAVMAWLQGGMVRYEPVIRNGHPVAEEQRWVISFRS